jgi:hypothetical protein
MNQDIIEMAREAGMTKEMGSYIFGVNALQDFAKLVAAKEREACAKVCDELPAADIYNDTDQSMWDVTCMDCSTAIRARGEA